MLCGPIYAQVDKAGSCKSAGLCAPMTSVAFSCSYTTTGSTFAVAHWFEITSHTEALSCVPTPKTQRLPGFIIAAFSAAMASFVSPKIRIWSKPMPVMPTVVIDCMALVASHRPPMPHSNTTQSQCARANITQAPAVIRSNSVILYGSLPAFLRAAFTRAPAFCAAAIPSANSSCDTHTPAISTLSVYATSPGDVYKPQRNPHAPSSAAV